MFVKCRLGAVHGTYVAVNLDENWFFFKMFGSAIFTHLVQLKILIYEMAKIPKSNQSRNTSRNYKSDKQMG